MLIRAFTYEYLLLGLATAIFALLAGSVAAWYVVSQVMKLPVNLPALVALATLALALVTTIGIGLAAPGGCWAEGGAVLREL